MKLCPDCETPCCDFCSFWMHETISQTERQILARCRKTGELTSLGHVCDQFECESYEPAEQEPAP